MPVGSVASASSFGSPETQATYGGCYGRLSLLSDHSFPSTSVAVIEKKTSLDWIKVPVYRSVIIVRPYWPPAGDECEFSGGGGLWERDPKDGAQKSHSRPLQRLWNHIAGVNDEIRSALHLYLSLFGDECEWVGGAIGLYAQIPHTSFTESAESVPHRYDDAELQNTYIKSL